VREALILAVHGHINAVCMPAASLPHSVRLVACILPCGDQAWTFWHGRNAQNVERQRVRLKAGGMNMPACLASSSLFMLQPIRSAVKRM
jgi:hypothetical protein